MTLKWANIWRAQFHRRVNASEDKQHTGSVIQYITPIFRCTTLNQTSLWKSERNVAAMMFKDQQGCWPRNMFYLGKSIQTLFTPTGAILRTKQNSSALESNPISPRPSPVAPTLITHLNLSLSKSSDLLETSSQVCWSYRMLDL